MKKFLSKYGFLVIIEFFIVLIYVVASPKIVGNSGLEVLFSSEVLVTLLVGVGAVYSWLHSRKSEEYESDLKLLQNIDDVIKDNPKNALPQQLYSEIYGFVSELNEKYQKTDTDHQKFLNIYYQYINNKVSVPDKGESDTESYTINNKIDKVSLVKSKICEKEGVEKKYIRFSRNYEEVTEDSGFKWSTWYSLPKELIVNSRNEDKFIFFTKVGGYYKGVWILGDNLKKLIDNMTPSTEKSGKQTYDFYICEKLDGSYYESRYANELSHYEVEPLELDYLN